MNINIKCNIRFDTKSMSHKRQNLLFESYQNIKLLLCESLFEKYKKQPTDWEKIFENQTHVNLKIKALSK